MFKPVLLLACLAVVSAGELPKQCTSFILETDKRRMVTENDGDLCDNNLASGWHRFYINGTNYRIPTR